MYMTREASWFYLSRTLPFMNPTEMARELSVSRLTLDRWTELGLVPVKSQANFEALLERLAKRFVKMQRRAGVPSFYEALEEAMMEHEPARIKGEEVSRYDTETFVERITPLLKRKQGLPRSQAMSIGAEYQLPMHVIYRVVKEMNVTKDVRGKGINMVSTWYL